MGQRYGKKNVRYKKANGRCMFKVIIISSYQYNSFGLSIFAQLKIII